MTSFSELVARAREGALHVPESWSQGRSVFGGLIAGAALARLAALVEAESEAGASAPPLRSAQVFFVGPVAPERDTEIVGTVLRSGRTMTQTRAEVSQDGAIGCSVHAAFGAPRGEPVDVDIARPELGAPDDARPLPYLPGVVPSFTQHVDMRWEGGGFPFSGASEARIRGWVRHRTEASGVAAVVALIDAWPAPVLPLLHTPAPASSVNWSLELRIDDLDASGWYGYTSRATWTVGGYARFDSELWTEDGALAATSSQLVAVFPRDRRP